MKLALIGSNFIVDWFMNGARETEEIEIAATYSRTREQAEINRDKWGAARALWDFDDLLQDGEIEAVYIASPNRCHFEQAKALLSAGKHVMVEKTATLCTAQFEELLSIARDRNVVLMEAVRPLHYPFLDRIRTAAELIGPLRSASFPYCQYSSRYDRFKQGILTNTFDPMMGGGSLMDIGVYCVNWMIALLGLPKEITAMGIHLPGSIDSHIRILCRYDEVLSEISASKVFDSLRPCVLEGERGSVEITPFPFVREMRVIPRGGKAERIDFGAKEHDMAYEIADFRDAVRGLADPGPWQENTLAALRILDEVRSQCGITFSGIDNTL